MNPTLAKLSHFLFCVLCWTACSEAQALNILLTNDDGYQHRNIRALYTELKAAGHRVKISAPQADQSAKGGAFVYGTEVVTGQDSDPAYPDSHFVKTFQSGRCVSESCQGRTVKLEISGTPVMAALYGIEKLMPDADLVISGPNIGNNLGFINHYSGTFNAALLALKRGIPALAVSADFKEPDPARVARLISDLVRLLETRRAAGEPLLPRGLGLNINLPPTPQIKGVRLAEIGVYLPFDVLYVDDLASLNPAQAGRFGIGFKPAAPPAAGDAESEAVWVAQGYVTVSPFTAGLGPGNAEPLRRLLELLILRQVQ
jgi:5'-nucleotidase